MSPMWHFKILWLYSYYIYIFFSIYIFKWWRYFNFLWCIWLKIEGKWFLHCKDNNITLINLSFVLNQYSTGKKNLIKRNNCHEPPKALKSRWCAFTLWMVITITFGGRIWMSHIKITTSTSTHWRFFLYVLT